MNQLQLFLPCAAGVEDYLAVEAARITGQDVLQVHKWRAGVLLQGSWRDAMLLNLHSRLAQRVLVQLHHAMYRNEQDLYRIAGDVAWEIWFTPRESMKVEVTAQHSPLTSLNFAALKIKDAVCDRFRARCGGVRPDVDTRWPDIRIYTHLTTDTVSLYIDTSGEALFKRGWREDKGDAPLKETLAAAMLAASGWSDTPHLPLYDPCCGSGTIAIEAAQMACNIAPGALRRFAFEKMLPFQPHVWDVMRESARQAQRMPAPGEPPTIFGSDVSHRMVDFAQRNARRAGVAEAIEFRGGDALQRMPPCEAPAVMMVNPPYGERIATAGFAGAHAQRHAGRDPREAWDEPAPASARSPREQAHTEDGGDFFVQLAAHWKKHFAGWTVWMLTPDLKLPGTMRLKAGRRVPMWNGPIECRMFRFDMVQGSARSGRTAGPSADA
ncbi:THUMP domain-containing protein [Comamonadaceae bacterium G21597-S1]|nr:THUMP domain-containing protein [Comamonadaceae bacterium G21597-S1]